MVGNWKMNPETLGEAREIFSKIKRAAKKNGNVATIICPPSIFISSLSELLEKSVKVGAQDVFWAEDFAHTGQIDSRMLKQFGCEYVILGHSEMRAVYDTDETVSKKVLAALKENIKVILCIGEKERDPHGVYLEFLTKQIKNSLSRVQKKSLDKIYIAYEPLWAIGKSEAEAINSESMHSMSIFVRKVLSDMYGKEEASSVSIIYGGSVTPENAAQIFVGNQIDGFLLGRQSLSPEGFGEIMAILNKL